MLLMSASVNRMNSCMLLFSAWFQSNLQRLNAVLLDIQLVKRGYRERNSGLSTGLLAAAWPTAVDVSFKLCCLLAEKRELLMFGCSSGATNCPPGDGWSFCILYNTPNPQTPAFQRCQTFFASELYLNLERDLSISSPLPDNH